MNRRLCILAAALSLVALGACSEDNKVGTGVKVEKGEGGANRLGVTTTTEAPEAAAAAAPTTTAAPAPTTTAKAAAPTTTAKAAPAPTTTAAPATTAPAAQAFVIEIYGDNSGKKQFEPPQSGVRLGTVVRWVNKDTINRGVESQEAGFQSPLIPPGGTFDFKTDAKGTFNYQDTTRPYAVAVLQVG
jgi:plastocyanin